MGTPRQPASLLPPQGQIHLETPWTSRWENFWQAANALRTRLPVLPPRATLTAFRGTCLSLGWPAGALLASGLFHIAFVLLPMPRFVTHWPRPKPFSTVRIEYDLAWAPGSVALPPMAPPERQKPDPTRKARMRPPTLPEVPTVPAPQVMVSEPRRPNHPTQTLLSNFPEASAPVDSLDLKLPNLVIPKMRTAAPKVELNLRRLSLPQATYVASPMPLPPRPTSAGERALAESRLEKLSPRLNATGSETPPLDAPEVGAPVGTAPDAAAVPPALVALTARPALPSEVLELPETHLRARFAAGQDSGEAPAVAETGSSLGGAVRDAGALPVSGILVKGDAALPPAPVVAGPLSNDPAGASLPTSRVTLQEPEDQPAKLSDQEARRRAEEMLSGIQPGTRRPSETGVPRVYTIYITMPNLTSQSGSWVLRFSEQGPASRTAAGGAANGFPLEAPLAIKKVDPRYPPAARRARIEGVVTLYGVIRADGRVENVQVVRSLDEMLDTSAVAAFRRWEFEPGRMNGVPVGLEVVVEIPFRLGRLF